MRYADGNRLLHGAARLRIPAIAALVLTAAAVLTVLAVLHAFHARSAASRTPGATSIATQRAQWMDLAASLDEAPAPSGVRAGDVEEVRAREELLLEHYTWVEEARGKVRIRIPIERAMELTAQRGLPVREKTASPRSTTELRQGSGISGQGSGVGASPSRAEESNPGADPRKEK